MEAVFHLFDSSVVLLDEVRFGRDRITLVVRSASRFCDCPLCAAKASRVHSFYWRKVADLPWLGTRVTILWRSRRFFCDNPQCARKIFTDRCPVIAERYARRTTRLNRTLRSLAVVCGGEMGSRLACRMGLPPISGDTLLRLIRLSAQHSSVTPRVVGVDDWAIRRGQRYGTIICDLERHCVVDLLPERSAESFATWLKRHPGVEVISRDRGDIYIRGATVGAPEAVQVADRWHLLKNLNDALIRILDRYTSEIQDAVHDVRTSNESEREESLTKANSPAELRGQNARSQLIQQHRQSRVERYERIRQLREQGLSIREIARRMGMHRTTVRRFAYANTFPERQQRRCTRGTDADDEFLRRRWKEGCHNAKQLTRELMDRGFKGSYYMVMRHVRAWRESKDETLDANVHYGHTRRTTSRKVAWILLRAPEERTESEQLLVTALCESCPAIASIHRLASDFHSMMKHHDTASLDSWLARARTSKLKRFGDTLAEDKAAVQSAFELPWSNGQTEGQVNRLKTLKRQMYGRGGIDLLKTRMLADQSVQQVAP